MIRRDFITLLGGAAAAWPMAAHPQEAGRSYRLGFMVPLSPDAPSIVAFFDELRLAGFIEGQNLIVVPGGFDVRDERLTERAAVIRSYSTCLSALVADNGKRGIIPPLHE